MGLVAAIQFVNILDFMMVMPLGPDFAAALGIPLSHLGYIGGSYTAASSLAGIAGSFFLDRYDRRQALFVAMLGLVAGTALGAMATGIATLMAARVIAGVFGGPAAALSMSIIADVVPVERRGRAMGWVMTSFTVAQVMGVPAGLELARLGGWRAPFLAVAGLGLVISMTGLFFLPPMRIHLERRQPARTGITGLLAQPTVLLAWAAGFCAMMSGFILVPNFAAYLQGNLGYPRDRLGLIYLLSGLCGFVAMRLAGPAVDRLGSFAVAVLAFAGFLPAVWLGFGHYWSVLPIPATFMAFWFFMAARNVSFSTLVTRVPRPQERARFMSIATSTQHMAGAIGAFLSSLLLSEGPGGSLVGMAKVARVSIALAAAMLPLMAFVERRVKLRETDLRQGLTAARPTVP